MAANDGLDSVRRQGRTIELRRDDCSNLRRATVVQTRQAKGNNTTTVVRREAKLASDVVWATDTVSARLSDHGHYGSRTGPISSGTLAEFCYLGGFSDASEDAGRTRRYCYTETTHGDVVASHRTRRRALQKSN